MKKYIAFLSMFLLASLGFSQEFKAPKQGSKIYAKEYVIDINEGAESSFDLWIVRSSRAKRAEFENPILLSSSGLTFEVFQNPENKDRFSVKVSAKSVAPGQYTTTVSAKANGSHRVTGTTLSFQVLPAHSVASKDGE